MSASGEWIINGKLTDSCEKPRGSETINVEKVRKIPGSEWSNER